MRKPKWRDTDVAPEDLKTVSLKALVKANQEYLAFVLNAWSAEKYERYVGFLNPFVTELEKRENTTMAKAKIKCPHCQENNEFDVDQTAVDGEGQDITCDACGEAFMVASAKDGITAIAL